MGKLAGESRLSPVAMAASALRGEPIRGGRRLCLRDRTSRARVGSRGQRDRKNATGVGGDVSNLADLDRLFAQIKLDGKDQQIDVVFTDIRLGGELNG